MVAVDWIVSEAPAVFLTTLEDIRSEDDRDDAVAGMLQMWQAGVADPDLGAFLAEMGAASGEMWDRAAREIESSYARYGSPLRALSQLEPPLPVLNLLPASGETCSLERQKAYTSEHHWYHAVELPARSHFPAFEVPERMAEEIERFATRVGGRRRLRRVA
jgi:hypothetical protein